MFLIKLIVNKTNNIVRGINPINTTRDNKEECGSRNDSGSLMTISPYNWPKFNGPEPINSSVYVGLYLAKNSPHISDLFRKNPKVLNKPKILPNSETSSWPLFKSLK